jgi:hypothetical protein
MSAVFTARMNVLINTGLSTVYYDCAEQTRRLQMAVATMSALSSNSRRRCGRLPALEEHSDRVDSRGAALVVEAEEFSNRFKARISVGVHNV